LASTSCTSSFSAGNVFLFCFRLDELLIDQLVQRLALDLILLLLEMLEYCSIHVTVQRKQVQGNASANWGAIGVS